MLYFSLLLLRLTVLLLEVALLEDTSDVVRGIVKSSVEFLDKKYLLGSGVNFSLLLIKLILFGLRYVYGDFDNTRPLDVEISFLNWPSYFPICFYKCLIFPSKYLTTDSSSLIFLFFPVIKFSYFSYMFLITLNLLRY